jgi:hypothetical protein
MTCVIDHTLPGTLPAFLCRGCHPELVTPRTADQPVYSARVPAVDDFRSRYPLSEKDKEAIAELGAIEEAVRKARSYARIETLRNRVAEKIAERKTAAPDQPLDLDDLKQVVIVHKRPGIIATLMEMMRRKEGASRAEMLAELIRLHPDRDPKGMGSTVNIQSNKLSTSIREDGKRGKVYHMVVEE